MELKPTKHIVVNYNFTQVLSIDFDDSLEISRLKVSGADDLRA